MSQEQVSTSPATSAASRASSTQSSRESGSKSSDGPSDGQEDKRFCFFETSYANKAIVLLEDRHLVRKTVKSAAYVYLDQKLAVGDQITFQVANKETTVSNCSFFAVTTCSLKRIDADFRHTNYICSKNNKSCAAGRNCSKTAACSKGESFCVPIDDLLDVGDKFQIEVATGALFLKYEKKAGKVRPVPRDQDLHPLLIIDSDYTEFRIISNDEFKESRNRVGFEVLTTTGSSLTSPGKLLQATLNNAAPAADVPASVSNSLSASGTRHLVSGSKSGGTPASARVVNKITPALVSEQAQAKVRFTFLDPWYENPNITTSACLLTASIRPEPGSGSKNKNNSKIVFLTPRLFNLSCISLLIEKVVEKPSSGCCFIFGLTSCDIKSLRSNDCHSQQMCSPSRPCKGSSIAFTVSSKLADGPGSVITFERQADGKFKIRCGNNVNKKLEWAEPANFTKKVHVFLILNGDATQVRSLNDAESADLMLKQIQRSKVPIPVRAKSVKKYRFMIPSYSWQGVTVSPDQKVIRSTDSMGARIVYFDTDLITHTPLKLRIDAKSDGPKDNSFGFVLLVSSCSPDLIKSQDWHSTGVCNSDSKCRGISQSYGVTEKLDVESVVIITRICNGFITIQVDDKSYEMQDHKSLFTGYPVCPALRLTGCVTSVSIIDKNEKHVSPAVAKPESPVVKKIQIPASKKPESPAVKAVEVTEVKKVENPVVKKTEVRKSEKTPAKQSNKRPSGKKPGVKKKSKPTKPEELPAKPDVQKDRTDLSSVRQETEDSNLVPSVVIAVTPASPETSEVSVTNVCIENDDQIDDEVESSVPAIECPVPSVPVVLVDEPPHAPDSCEPPAPESASTQEASSASGGHDEEQACNEPVEEEPALICSETEENEAQVEPEPEPGSAAGSESESGTESDAAPDPSDDESLPADELHAMTESPDAGEEDQESFTAVVRKKRKPRTRSSREENEPSITTPDIPSPPLDFEFFVTPYLNSYIVIMDKKRVERMGHDGYNIVYLNRRLGPDDCLNLKVLSFGRAESLNLIFGITTCDTQSIAIHKSHIKSFCRNDGRPCGGQSLVCELNRGVRGSNVISFKKVPEGINFLSDGFLVEQFKDEKNLFKRTPVTPFLALRGDVESIAILDSNSSIHSLTRTPSPTGSSIRASSRTEDQVRPPPGFSSLRRISPIRSHSSLQPLRLVSQPQPLTPEPLTPEPVARKTSVSLSLDTIEAAAAAMFLPKCPDVNPSFDILPETSLLSYEDRIIRPPDPAITPSPAPVPRSGVQEYDDAGDSPVLTRPSARVSRGRKDRKWYSNLSVSWKNNVITRTPTPDERSYIFSHELMINESISFRVQDTDMESDDGSVIFGLTSTPILRVDLSALPSDPRVLTESQNGCKWFVSRNLLHTIGACDGLTLTRTESAVVMNLEPNGDGVEEMPLIRSVDATSIVYPFFHLDGCVRSIRLLTREPVEPVSFKNQSRLYLTSFYFSLLNSVLKHMQT